LTCDSRFIVDTNFYPVKVINMSTVIDIEAAIERLPEEEFKQLEAWFSNRAADQWDVQFEADARNGRLDRLAEEALAELRTGRVTPRAKRQ